MFHVEFLFLFVQVYSCRTCFSCRTCEDNEPSCKCTGCSSGRNQCADGMIDPHLNSTKDQTPAPSHLLQVLWTFDCCTFFRPWKRFGEMLADPELIAAAILVSKCKTCWTSDENILKLVKCLTSQLPLNTCNFYGDSEMSLKWHLMTQTHTHTLSNTQLQYYHMV